MTDPTLTAALAEDGVTMFCAVRIALPSYTLLLLDGAGQVTFNSETYIGLDPNFGALDSVDVISGGEGDQAPELSLVIAPPSATAAATLSSPNMQGSQVYIYVGAINPATGLVRGAPELKFMGEIDVPTLTSSNGQRSLEYSIISVFDRLFDVDEGIRASDGWHQSIWPGERGLEYMTGTDKNLYWGGKPPATTQASSPAFGRLTAGQYAQYAKTVGAGR